MTVMDEILDAAFETVLGDAFTGAAEIQKPRDSRSRKIVRQEAHAAGIPVAAIFGDSRTHTIAHARQAVMFRISRELGWSLPKIGRFLGGRDHTTIIHGIRAHQRRQSQEV